MTRELTQGLADAAAFVRYARGLRTYMTTRPDEQECRRRIHDRLAHREDNLVRLLEERIFGVPASPYRALFGEAGIELGDAVGAVREEGVEGALGRFYDAGVYVKLDEFKGRVPIRRGSLTLAARGEDFDNPGGRYVFTSSSSGSRGPARRTKLDFAYMEENSVWGAITWQVGGALDRPYAIWRPVLPGGGLRSAVNHVKRGQRMERWFSQTPFVLAPGVVREYLLTRYTMAVSRRIGLPIPDPEHVPLDRADVVARWLAGKRAQGTPALLSAFVSSVVRVCLAAREGGHDISGTMFRGGGEPLTEAKARVIREVGCTIRSGYAMAELGNVGQACLDPVELDEVHLAEDKLGIIQRDRQAGGATVGALLYTTLLPTSAKVMLNVESDDYGVIVERDCACPVGEFGLRRHLHTIRSYEKLTSEGMNFVGVDLLRLVEEVLPARFGGGPADYQLVEEEVDGLPKVSVVVSPRLGELDDATVVRTVLETLGSGPAYKDMMASVWRSGDTLKVVRREPHATSSTKIQPLHIVRR